MPQYIHSPQNPSPQPIATSRRIKTHYQDLLSSHPLHPRIQKAIERIRRLRLAHPPPYNQSALDSPQEALDIPGVLYYKGNINSKKGYVGKALNLIRRDRDHHVKARKGEADAPELTRAIRKSHPSCCPLKGGWFLIPLEIIDPTSWSSIVQFSMRQKAFNKIALPREQAWIRHLRTARRRGWNVSLTYINSKVRRGKHIPPPARREKCQTHNNAPQTHQWWRPQPHQENQQPFSGIKRCMHRLLQLTAGARKKALLQFKPTKLRRFLFHFEQIPIQERENTHTTLLTDLRTTLSDIRWSPQSRRPMERDVLKILFRRKDLQDSGLARILRNPEVANLHPDPESAKDIA